MVNMSKRDNKIYDENIIVALQKLPIPLETFDGGKVYFVENKRKEKIFEHIARTSHRFRVSDIGKIPEILKSKDSLQKDKKKKDFKNYIGRRVKKNDKTKYIKIVTRKIGKNKEAIISIYLIKEKVEKK